MGVFALLSAAAALFTASTAAPAPWTLRGDTYLMLFRPGEDRALFVHDELREPAVADFVIAMFVDYRESPVGPYQELLFIPGTFEFGERRLPAVTKMYVSSEASAVNGRRNWGLPKELATFEVRQLADRRTRVLMRVGGRRAVELYFREGLIPVPLSSLLVPEELRTIGQKLDDKSFEFAPTTSGWLKAAATLQAWSDPAFFPEISPEQMIATLKFSSFEAVFPVATVY